MVRFGARLSFGSQHCIFFSHCALLSVICTLPHLDRVLAKFQKASDCSFPTDLPITETYIGTCFELEDDCGAASRSVVGDGTQVLTASCLSFADGTEYHAQVVAGVFLVIYTVILRRTIY
jgi:hypothetical protein